MPKEKAWHYAATGAEQNAELFGVRIFDTDFKPAGERTLFNGRYYDIYYVSIDGEYCRFAMAEISNGVYEFLLYQY